MGAAVKAVAVAVIVAVVVVVGPGGAAGDVERPRAWYGVARRARGGVLGKRETTPPERRGRDAQPPSGRLAKSAHPPPLQHPLNSARDAREEDPRTDSVRFRVRGATPPAESAAVSHPDGRLGPVGAWTAGELLGFDLETTGVDRFNDVPVSYALVYAVGGRIRVSWSGLIDPGRAIPGEAMAVHGITDERARTEGMPLRDAIALLSDVLLSASRRRVPLVGMQLDYDLTMLEAQGQRLFGRGITEHGWSGPALDAAVLDRHFDPDREGRRTLSALCGNYGVEFAHAHDASADAVASMGVVLALAARCPELRNGDLGALHRAQGHLAPGGSPPLR
jgi:DNA polymerase III subunit epsilon